MEPLSLHHSAAPGQDVREHTPKRGGSGGWGPALKALLERGRVRGRGHSWEAGTARGLWQGGALCGPSEDWGPEGAEMEPLCCGDEEWAEV